MKYAEARGLQRGSSKRLDNFPEPNSGDTPILDPANELNGEAEDEGLLAFVQAVSCRRNVWAKAFESPIRVSELEFLSDEGEH